MAEVKAVPCHDCGMPFEDRYGLLPPRCDPCFDEQHNVLRNGETLDDARAGRSKKRKAAFQKVLGEHEREKKRLQDEITKLKLQLQATEDENRDRCNDCEGNNCTYCEMCHDCGITASGKSAPGLRQCPFFKGAAPAGTPTCGGCEIELCKECGGDCDAPAKLCAAHAKFHATDFETTGAPYYTNGKEFVHITGCLTGNCGCWSGEDEEEKEDVSGFLPDNDIIDGMVHKMPCAIDDPKRRGFWALKITASLKGKSTSGYFQVHESLTVSQIAEVALDQFIDAEMVDEDFVTSRPVSARLCSSDISHNVRLDRKLPLDDMSIVQGMSLFLGFSA